MPSDTPSLAAKPASGTPLGGEMQTLLNPAFNKGPFRALAGGSAQQTDIDFRSFALKVGSH